MHYDDETVFYLWDHAYETSEKILTIYAFTGDSREEFGLSDGRFILHKTESVVYAAHIEPQAEQIGLTQENVVYSFRLIQHDWKTGET